MPSPVDDRDEVYRAGYRQGVLDADANTLALEMTPARRYTLAAGTLIAGIGSAVVGAMLFNPKYRHVGGIIAFSAATLGAVFGAAHILVDKHPVTPNLRLR